MVCMPRSRCAASKSMASPISKACMRESVPFTLLSSVSGSVDDLCDAGAVGCVTDFIRFPRR